MSFESYEDYVRLNEHLWELDPIARTFADEHGYEYGPPLTNGLYPKLRLWRVSNGVSQNSNFDMEFTEREERFDDFFPKIPYSVYAGSWIDDEKKRIHFHGPHEGIRRTPFIAPRGSIDVFLSRCHWDRESVTPELVHACGLSSPLHGHPQSGKTSYLA